MAQGGGLRSPWKHVCGKLVFFMSVEVMVASSCVFFQPHFVSVFMFFEVMLASSCVYFQPHFVSVFMYFDVMLASSCVSVEAVLASSCVFFNLIYHKFFLSFEVVLASSRVFSWGCVSLKLLFLYENNIILQKVNIYIVICNEILKYISKSITCFIAKMFVILLKFG